MKFIWSGSGAMTETGETVTGDRSSLLFIPVTYWTHVILLVGVIVEAFLLLGRFGD
ncbi:MAG: hypothetical protein P8X69_13835 [Maritimibacter sp.]